jgi:hypothetical protein
LVEEAFMPLPGLLLFGLSGVVEGKMTTGADLRVGRNAKVEESSSSAIPGTVHPTRGGPVAEEGVYVVVGDETDRGDNSSGVEDAKS